MINYLKGGSMIKKAFNYFLEILKALPMLSGEYG